MTNGELCRYLAKLIFTTSDPGSKKIYDWCKHDEEFLKFMLKEYIYLKAYLSARLTFSAGGQQGDAEFIMDQTFKILDVAFKNDPFSYGCNYKEMLDRLNYYFDDQDDINIIVRKFTNVIGATNLATLSVDVFSIINLTKETSDYLRNSLIQKTSGNKSGCGCLSVIACFMLFALAFAI